MGSKEGHAGTKIRLGQVIVLLVLAAVVISLIVAHVLAWRWVRQPFPGMLLEPTLVLSPLRGRGWARLAFDPPLAQPDRLVAIDGQRVNRSADVNAILSEHDVGDSVRVRVTRPDGTSREEQITLASFPLRDILLIFILPYLAGLAYLATGIWVYWVQGRRPAGQIFTGMCAAMALVVITIFDLNTTHRLAVLWCAAAPLAAATTIHLALIFPRKIRFVRWYPILQLLPYLPAMYLAFRSALSVHDIGRPWAYINHWRATYLWGALGILFLLAVLVYRLIRPTSPLVRQQSRIMLLGATLAFLPVFPWLLVNFLGQPAPFLAGIYAPLFTLFPLAIAYTIVRYRLLDVDRFLSQGVAYGTLTFLVVAVYFALVNILSHFFAVRANDPILLSIFVLTLTLLFNPLRNSIQRLVDRIFLRETVNYHTALQDFSHELTRTLDLNAVLMEIGKRIDQTLHPASQWICLYDEDLGYYVGQPIGHGQHVAFPVTFAPDGPMAHWLREHQECLYLPPERGVPVELASEWVQMGVLGAVVYVPLRTRERLIGWLALGPKQSGHPHRSDDLAFLSALADQSALAVENARLFTSVRRNLAAITDMKNLMDDVFSSIASGVITTDVRDKVTLFNRAAEAILDIKAEEVVGCACREILNPLGEDLPILVKQVKHTEASVMAHEVQPELPTRGAVWLRMNLSPLKDSRDVTTGVAIVVDDMTEQRRLEARARLIKETFQRYVAPAVVERLLSNPELVRLGGLRQEITSFYADIRGFTAFSERTQPEFQIEVLNEHLTLATEAILEQEGTVDKFVGDAIMAIFNAPEAQEDHTMRAVRAALAMQQVIREHHTHADEGKRLRFGIGITVGEAVVGNIGSVGHQRDFTAIGDCVNFSSRLSDIAGPGQILLSSEAYERVAEQIEAGFVGDVQVKGHSQPDPVYEVFGLRSESE